MFNRCVGNTVNALILFSDSGNNLTPAEAIKIKKISNSVKWRGRCLFEVDEFEGFEIQLAEGFGLEYPGRGECGLKCWRISDDAGGEGDFRMRAEEDDALTDGMSVQPRKRVHGLTSPSSTLFVGLG
jgi:hypothetical protein